MDFSPRSRALFLTAAILSMPAALQAATRTVTLSQTVDDKGNPVCSVDHMELAVEPGDDVEFQMVTDGKAKKAKIKKKKDAPEKVKFGNPPPWEAKKGHPANSGAIRRDGGDRWEYDVVFKKKWFVFDVEVCTVDPVICIKDGLSASPDPEVSAEDDDDRGLDECS